LKTKASRTTGPSRHLPGSSGAFAALWFASTGSNLADGLFRLALPLFAATLTRTPGQVAGVMTALTLPWLLLALPAGSLADRLDRRLLVIAAQLLRAALLIILVGLVLGTETPALLLYALAFALGSAEVVADTAAAALVPAVAGPDALEEANARLVGSLTAGNEFAGPALGGMLFTLSAAAPFGVSAGLCLASAAALTRLRGSFRPVRTAARNWCSEILEGLTFLWRHGLLRTLALLVLVMNFCWAAWLTLMPLHAVSSEALNLTAAGYGLLLACLGAGGILGTLLVLPARRLLGQRRTLGIDLLGTLVMLLMPALTANPWLIGLAALAGGAGSTMWSVLVSSIRQRTVSDALQGRVGAALRLFGFGAFPLGAATAGIVAEITGIRMVFLICSFLVLSLFLPFIRGVTEAELAKATRP
jgi:MFS family permease